MTNPVWWIFVLGAYLIGAIPFGLLIGWMRGVDIRKAGSGNIGATNLGRVVGRKWGLIGFLLDVIKGAAPVLAAGFYFGWITSANLPGAGAAWQWLVIAVAAILGHVYPVYLGFRGGKGVATSFGVLLGVWPYLTIPAIGGLITWLLFASALRYVSLASVIAAVALPCYVALTAACSSRQFALSPFLIITSLMALLVIVRHRANLVRLARGTENRLK